MLNNMQNLSQMTGMPIGGKSKVRRGGGRFNKGTPTTPTVPTAPKAPTTPDQHMTALQGHMKSGNAAGAKSAALMLAKALHAKTGSSKPKTASNAMPTAPIGPPKPPKAVMANPMPDPDGL